MKVCGPKYAICGMILSVWGVIQLILMGVFFYTRSVGLIEDLEIEKDGMKTISEFYYKADSTYSRCAHNCWIAACIYVLTFLFSGYQFWENSKSSLSV